MRLTVANLGASPLHFEEALHTYLHVGDATRVSLQGLGGAQFIDKTDNLQRKTQQEPVLHLTGETDGLYLNTETTVTLEDPELKRTIAVAKAHSASTVIWNPWSALSARMPDMTAENWRSMTCIETVNAAENAILLAPGGAHTMEAHISVGKL